jgi:hypothetical protein
MLSIGLWRWYINIAINILDIIHRPIFYLKYDVSEAGFCLRIQVETTQLGPTNRGTLCLHVIPVGPNWVVSTWRWRQNPVSEMSALYKRRWIISRILIVMNGNCLTTVEDSTCCFNPIYLIFPAALRPWNRLRNEPQDSSWGRLGRTTSLSSVNRLSRKCGSLDVSHTHWLSQSLTEIALFLFTFNPLLMCHQLWRNICYNWCFITSIADCSFSVVQCYNFV